MAYLYIVSVCIVAPAALVAGRHDDLSSSKDGASIGLVVAMAAVVTGLVGVAIGLAVRHVNKRRQNQRVTGRQGSIATDDNDDDVEDGQVSEYIKSTEPSGALDVMQ